MKYIVGSAKEIANEFQKALEVNEVREVMGSYDKLTDGKSNLIIHSPPSGIY